MDIEKADEVGATLLINTKSPLTPITASDTQTFSDR